MEVNLLSSSVTLPGNLLACGRLMIMAIDNHRADLRLILLLLLLLCSVLPFFLLIRPPPLHLCFCFISVSDMTKHKPKAESRPDGAEGPDGGWGWVLVGALFVSTSLVFGLMRSLGIFFVEFVQYFEESAQAISWISSTGLAAQQFFSEYQSA